MGKWSELQNKPVPTSGTKKDPMRGNLDTPWLYLCLYLLLFVCSVSFIVLSAYVLRPAEYSAPADAVEVETVFLSFARTEEDRDTFLLYAPGYEKPFAIEWMSGYEVPIPEPEALCDGSKYRITACEACSQYYIYALSSADKGVVFSAFDYNTAYRNTQRVPCIGLLIFGSFFAVFSVFGIPVGRHPERFSAWFRGLFYKKSSWTHPALRKCVFCELPIARRGRA